MFCYFRVGGRSIFSRMYSVIHSINKYLLGSYCMPDTVLDRSVIAVNESDKSSCPHEIHILMDWPFFFPF